MGFSRFRDLVRNSILYFCSVQMLGKEDPHEGSFYACKLLHEVTGEDARFFAQAAHRCGPPVAVNCWHMNESQSMAMWKMYAESKGIAIQTTVGKLKAAFGRVRDPIRLGAVIYTDEPIDHPSGWTADLLWACMTKRKCFEHERELRALVWDTEELQREPNGSALVPVDVNSLVEDIWLAPDSPDDLLSKVHEALAIQGIRIEPKKSSLYDRPRF